jgi:hypothetical protein
LARVYRLVPFLPPTLCSHSIPLITQHELELLHKCQLMKKISAGRAPMPVFRRRRSRLYKILETFARGLLKKSRQSRQSAPQPLPDLSLPSRRAFPGSAWKEASLFPPDLFAVSGRGSLTAAQTAPEQAGQAFTLQPTSPPSHPRRLLYRHPPRTI